MTELDFDAVCRWLDDRLGRRLRVSIGSPSDGYGNTALHIHGELSRAHGEVTLIDASPGRVEAFGVGDAVLIVLEGDFVTAEPFEALEPFAALTRELRPGRVHPQRGRRPLSRRVIGDRPARAAVPRRPP